MAGLRTNLSITDRELLYRLGWFTRLRWAAGFAAVGILLVSWFGLGVRFGSGGPAGLIPAIVTVAAVFVYNVAFAVLMRMARARARPSAPAMGASPAA